MHVDGLSGGSGHGLPASTLHQVKQVARLPTASLSGRRPAASMSFVIRHRVRAGERRAGRQAQRWHRPRIAGVDIDIDIDIDIGIGIGIGNGLDVTRDPSPRASW